MKRLLFIGTPADKSYLHYLKEAAGGNASIAATIAEVSTIAELELLCRTKGFTGVLSTSVPLLKRLLDRQHEIKNPSLDNYAGSLFTLPSGIEIVFLNPLEHTITVPYGKFMLKRFVSKLTTPETWFPEIPFSYEVADASNIERIFSSYSSAHLIAVDIETFKAGSNSTWDESYNPAISCVGYTAIWFTDSGTIRTHSCVVPFDSEFFLAWIRKFNWELQAPKILQNGKYDISYLLRYNAPLYNYLWDTATMFHCWYSELPKDLGFLGSFFVRKAMYWKDMANTSDLAVYYEYNCRDHWTTALVALAWMVESPAWAKKNYELEFPLLFPAIMCEMRGIKRDMTRLAEARSLADGEIEVKTKELQAMVGEPINTNSPKQVKKLLVALGCEDLESTDEKNLKKAAYRHPLNARLINAILDIRGRRKLTSTYLRLASDADKSKDNGGAEFRGRILYALNPHATDTGRLASKEHHFWTGLQIQNFPRGRDVKSTIISDSDFLFGECDSKQAESRDTAYISGDESLIAAVESTRDFHSTNCSAFFGVPYDAIYDDARNKTLNKELRDLAKRVNHGANYNMGANVLVETMGLENIYKAQVLLKLPKSWKPKDVAEHLLKQFHRVYPKIAGLYYTKVIKDVTLTKLLKGATGWTRYCFGDPGKNKRDLNAYVAHCPQSLNAMRLNQAFIKVFRDIQLHPEHRHNFKLLAQIHDSIFFMFREGHEYLAEMVARCMKIPITITGADGVVRTYTVPADVKAGKDGKGAKYWSDTE